jgi:alanyl-tRNA synthetase
VRETDVLPAVFRALDELERLQDEATALRGRLLAAEVAELRRDAMELSGPRAGRLVLRICADRPADELKRLALRLAQEPDSIALLGSTGERSHVVLAQSPGLPYDLSELLRQIGPRHGLRGGGTRDLAQGGGPSGADVAAALEEARQTIAVAPSERNVQ